jgi:hypothetical protein
MKLDADSSLKQVAASVAEVLARSKIRAVLTGGSSAPGANEKGPRTDSKSFSRL